MAQSNENFLIKKSTFIVKNNLSIDEVYNREKKVSIGGLIIFCV